MHYCSVENISKSYGIKPLFEDLSFHINEGDRIALIAKNGTGKSTLLKILAGKEQPEKGNLWIHKEVTVIFFEQNPLLELDKTVAENIFFHDHPVMKAIQAYEYATAIEDPQLVEEAISKMDELQAWDADAKVKQILTRLNIKHLDKCVGILSGGQQKRIALAKTLIDIGFGNKNVLLIMDEPTNHLDVEMVEWMESYLCRENTTLLLVTHDRYFLDTICKEIWELDRGKLYTYQGDYAAYLERKAARMESELATAAKTKNLYRRELEWMRKQPRARTVKSKSRQDRFTHIEKAAKQNHQEQSLQLQLKMNRLGGKILELKKVYKSYGSLPILKGFDYTFKRGERIGVVGPNGVGKSTFLHLLQGLEEADSGKTNVGETIVFGYYSQQGLQLKEDKRVIEYVKSIAENFPMERGGSLTAAQFLELFLFEPDKQHTFISKLSGGEKRRLHLLSVLFQNPNFLILDEPTNDLDLPTLSVLENFLLEFPGCLLIVSHDRYFMDRLVDHLFVFTGEGQVKDFPGNYSQFREEKNNLMLSSKEAVTENPSASVPAATGTKTNIENRISYKEKREFEQLEKDMESLSKLKEQLSNQLNQDNFSFETLHDTAIELEKTIKLLDQKELRWLELSEKL
ncbi:MAG: ABC-F family ATP-binding cassette domain-containing protein [Bacteroidetes bacterium]|nr:ABC-F family ATP-binding cassette domain-containing protein [Bacteroidota bacterium]